MPNWKIDGALAPPITRVDTGFEIAEVDVDINTELHSFFNPNHVEIKTAIGHALQQYHKIPIDPAVGHNIFARDLASGRFNNIRKIATFVCWYLKNRRPQQFPRLNTIQRLNFWPVNRNVNIPIVNLLNSGTEAVLGHRFTCVVTLSHDQNINWGQGGGAHDFTIKQNIDISSQHGLRDLFWAIVWPLERVWESAHHENDSGYLSQFPDAATEVTYRMINIVITKLPAGGGCSKLKSGDVVKIYDEQNRRIHDIMNLKSSNNNCLLACFREARKRYGSKMTASINVSGTVPKDVQEVLALNLKNTRSEFKFLRASCGFNTIEKINPLDNRLEDMCALAKVHLRVWNGRVETSTLISEWNVSSPIICDVLLRDEHYWFQGSKTKAVNYCSVCSSIHGGACSAAKTSYFQKKILPTLGVGARVEESTHPTISSKNNVFELAGNKWLKSNGFTNKDFLKHDMRDTLLSNPERASVQQCLFYDLETLRDYDESDGQHAVYALGCKVGGTEGVTQFWADDHLCVLDSFMQWVTDLPPLTISGALSNYYLVGFNQCRYDLKLLLEFLKKSEKWRVEVQTTDIMISSNRLIGLKVIGEAGRCLFVVWDPVLFLNNSLRNVCRDYKLSSHLQKSTFPHKIIDGVISLVETFPLSEINNPRNYFPGDVREITDKPYSVEDIKEVYREVGETYVAGENISIKTLGKCYLRRDVDSLEEITKMLIDEIYISFTGANILGYVTISQFAYNQWLKNLEYPLSLINVEQGDKYEFIKCSVYGGRVYPVKRYFETSQYSIEQLFEEYDMFGDEPEKIQLKFDEKTENRLTLLHGEELTDVVIEVDVTSLYPAQQLRENFPIEETKWLEQEDLDILLKRMQNFRVEEFQVPAGVYEIEFIPNAYLCQPILPVKKNGGLSWTLTTDRGIYTFVDVQRALEHGYDITSLTNALVWSKNRQVPLFRKFVKVAKKIKEAGDGNDLLGVPRNPTKRGMGKTTLNASYGKTTQKKILATSKFCTTEADIYEFVKNNEWNNAIYFSEDEVLMQGSKLEIENKYPNHLGSLILSYSRKNMDFLYRIIDSSCKITPEEWYTFDEREKEEKMRKSFEDTYFYTDTDSFYVKKKFWKDILEDQQARGVSGKDFGELKDESVDKGVIIFGWWLQPKTYAYITVMPDNSLVARCASKGIDARLLRLCDFTRGFWKREETLVEWDGIKHYGMQSAEKFMSVTSKKYTRTFNGQEYCGRVPIDVDTLEEDLNSSFTVPHGHYLDKSRLGKEGLRALKKRKREE
jgi:hypothetical protein